MHPEVPSNKSRSKKIKQRLSTSTSFVLSSHQVTKLVWHPDDDDDDDHDDDGDYDDHDDARNIYLQNEYLHNLVKSLLYFATYL